MVVIKVDWGGGWKNFAKLIMWSLCSMTYTKDFKILDLNILSCCVLHRIFIEYVSVYMRSSSWPSQVVKV